MSVNNNNKAEPEEDTHQLRNTWLGIGLFSVIWAATFGVVIAVL